MTYAVKSLRVKPGGESGSDQEASGSEPESDSSSDDGDSDSENDSDSEYDGEPRKLEAMTMEEVTNELIMMQQLSGHPNIVTVKEFFTEGAANTSAATTPSAAAAAAAVTTQGLLKTHQNGTGTAGHTAGGTVGDVAGNADFAPQPPLPPQPQPPTEGTVHVVMELLRGQELVDAIAEVGMYAEGDAKLVMSKMLDAIAFMHARGVVHRDLKLENLAGGEGKSTKVNTWQS